MREYKKITIGADIHSVFTDLNYIYIGLDFGIQIYDKELNLREELYDHNSAVTKIYTSSDYLYTMSDYSIIVYNQMRLVKRYNLNNGKDFHVVNTSLFYSTEDGVFVNDNLLFKLPIETINSIKETHSNNVVLLGGDSNKLHYLQGNHLFHKEITGITAIKKIKIYEGKIFLSTYCGNICFENETGIFISINCEVGEIYDFIIQKNMN